MPEWLTPRLTSHGEMPLDTLALRLVLAAVFGVGVATVYFVTQRKRRAEAAAFVSTLVLLSILLSMVSMVIGNDIARAFSLVGALAIVRFRTIVEDTRDTTFVIFAVITGMAAGSGAFAVPIVAIPLVAIVAAGLRVWGETGISNRSLPVGSRASNTLLVRVGIGTNPDGPLAEMLARHLDVYHLIAVSTARQGIAMDLTYAVRLRETATAPGLIAELNGVEGVQTVEWKESNNRT